MYRATERRKFTIQSHHSNCTTGRQWRTSKIPFSPFNSPRWASVVVDFLLIVVVDVAGHSNFVSRRVFLEQSSERGFHHRRTKSSLPLLPLAAVSRLIAFNVNKLSLCTFRSPLIEFLRHRIKNISSLLELFLLFFASIATESFLLTGSSFPPLVASRSVVGTQFC